MKLAIMGFGTIGSGVAAIVEQNAALIERRIGAPLEVKYVLDLREFPGTAVEHKVVHDIDIIVNDPEIDVVVETMGGVEPACTFVKKALNAGKSVTTSNKVLVEKKGAELLALAEEKGVSFLFEASVGGGIPIIRPLNQCLTGDRITGVTGILNGTTNYMLTKMDREGVTFEAALKEAQQNGFAEADPTADVEGLDASRKIAILSALAYGAQVDYQDVPTEGITKITDTDFRYARALGLSVKLLGSSRCIDGKYYIQVSPVLLPPEHPLAAVNGVFNAILVQGNMVDQLMFYGHGAGRGGRRHRGAAQSAHHAGQELGPRKADALRHRRPAPPLLPAPLRLQGLPRRRGRGCARRCVLHGAGRAERVRRRHAGHDRGRLPREVRRPPRRPPGHPLRGRISAQNRPRSENRGR